MLKYAHRFIGPHYYIKNSIMLAALKVVSRNTHPNSSYIDSHRITRYKGPNWEGPNNV